MKVPLKYIPVYSGPISNISEDICIILLFTPQMLVIFR